MTGTPGYRVGASPARDAGQVAGQFHHRVVVLLRRAARFYDMPVHHYLNWDMIHWDTPPQSRHSGVMSG